MRWQEFKLVENKQTEQFKIKKAETHLDALVDGTKDLPDDDPIKDKIIKKLSGIDSAIQNFITKIKGEVAKPTEPAVTEDVSTKNDELEAVKQRLFARINELDELYDHIPTEEGKALLEQNIANLDRDLYEAFLLMSKERKELIAKLNIATEKANEVENFFKGLLPLLRRLGNKVNDYTELTPEELEAMTGTERSRAKKRAVNAGKFAQTLAEAMSGKVLKLLSEGKTDTAKIKSFLNACLDGKVIKLDDMIKMNQGNIDDYVNQTFEQDYQNFVKENIFSYNPGATSGAIGPGELALAMLGDPASKATSGGDLFIGKGADRKLYEIKAGKGTSGGRMNSKEIVSATAGYPIWEKEINKILRDANAEGTVDYTNKDGEAIQLPLQQYDGSTFNKRETGKGNWKKGSNYNFNQSGIDKLNNDILIPYAKAAAENREPKMSARGVTHQLFHEPFKILIGNHEQIPDFSNIIYNAIKDDGTVEYTDMAKAYTSLAYKSYQLADKVKDILFIRTDTRHFAIIADHDDFQNALQDTTDEQGNVIKARVVIGSGFTWNDDQQTPTPTYLSAKHGE
tara:strand:+ start:3053 stop:4759 length:1707 start_codon:yes stop_codon:yes gene_type:complete